LEYNGSIYPSQTVFDDTHNFGHHVYFVCDYSGAQGLDPEFIEKLEQQFGFDKPAHERFFKMIVDYAQFDFGESYFRNIDVLELILEKMPVSVSLGLWITFLSYGISIPLGIKKAVSHGSRFDIWTSGIIIVAYAIPLTAMVLSSFATTTLLTKNSFLDEIGKQYVQTARAKGLTENKVLYGHVFRNAMLIIIAGFPAAFITSFFTGSLLIETIFSLDGLGLLGFESIVGRDYPVVFATLYIFSLMGLIVSLISDIIYTTIDPRIDFEARDV